MICPHCQTPNPDSAKFCLNCGTAIEPQPVVKGERRLVTVLFADVVGSTAMAENLDPELVTEIMNGAFAFLNDAVARHEGTVARLMGDAIMAFFGAPVAHENDAERAVRAGLDIRDAAREYGESIERAYGFEFNIRAGINTGLVVLATVGDQIRSEYTVMGDTVNVAARLQEAADPGSVLISGETHRLTRHLFDVTPRGPVQLKGKSTPVETHEVLKPKPVPETGRGLEGISSQLVGRKSELDILNTRLEQVQSGHGGIVTVVGEAGIGKSRLVAEIRKNVTADLSPQTRWIEGRALSYGQSPYYLWREVLLHSLGANPGDEPNAVRETLHETLATLHVPAYDIPFLEAILAVESEASRQAITALDGNVLRRHIVEAVRDYLQALAQQTPLVLVFDDLHWADAASMELLQSVADLGTSQPVLFIPVLRPEKDVPSWQFLQEAGKQFGERTDEIWLEPLDAEHSGTLLGNLLYIEDLPSNIRDLILKKSEGNPFFLEEIIRHLIDAGYIVRHNGHWRATKEIADVTVPDTLVGVLSSRIDRLPTDTKRVAQHASIIGRIFNYPVLKAVCMAAPPDERVEEPLPHLTKLTYEELLRERTHEPDLEYIFKHVLTQEAAYNLLLVRTRREYHQRAGQVLENLYADRLDEFSATLAHHFWHGEDWLRCADYAMRAANRAMQQLYALQEAHAHYERAYQALNTMQDPPPDKLCEVVVAWTPSALKYESHDEVLRRLHQAEQIARDTGNKLQLSQILHLIAHVHVWDGFSSRAMPALLENSELAAELGDERLRVYPAWFLANSLIDTNPRAALKQLADVVDMARRHRNREIEAHTLAVIAMTYARLGEFTKAQEYIDRAHEAISGLDAPVTVGDVYLMSSAAYFDMGDLERGLEYARIGTQKELEARAMECVTAGYCILGIGNLQLNKPAAALETFQRSLEVAQEIDPGDHRGAAAFQLLVNQVIAGMAIARYDNGQTEALEDMKLALKSSQAIDDRYTAAMVRLALSRAYRDLVELDLAEQHLNDAIAYYRQTELRPYLVRALEQQELLYQARGQTADAMRVRVEAQRISDELRSAVASPLIDRGTEPAAAPSNE